MAGDIQIDRADMKLLIEAGYSVTMRGLGVDVAPIFEAITEWMPDYAAGRIGMALQTMIGGDFAEADRMLTEITESQLQGRDEAQAILAMCKMLQDHETEARRLAEGLEGQGNHAEAFADVLVNGPEESTTGHQGPSMEVEAAPARFGKQG